MCRKVFNVFLVLYLIAIGLFLSGTFGLFGSDTGPLAGIFLIPLGMPWVFLSDFFPTQFAPWIGIGAPLINLLLIRMICRLRR